MFGLGKPKVLEEVESKYSGTLKVMQGYGHNYVNTGIWTQSGGIINDIWNPILKRINNQGSINSKSWLILGLATGTVAQIISKKYQPTKMVGVEIDPAMIRLGKKYFALDKIPNLQIINQDAEHFALRTSYFDYVLVDVYQGDELPGFVYSDEFLEKKLGQTVVFNHLFHSISQKQNAERLLTKLRKIYPKIGLNRVLTNLMIICA